MNGVIPINSCVNRKSQHYWSKITRYEHNVHEQIANNSALYSKGVRRGNQLGYYVGDIVPVVEHGELGPYYNYYILSKVDPLQKRILASDSAGRVKAKLSSIKKYFTVIFFSGGHFIFHPESKLCLLRYHRNNLLRFITIFYHDKVNSG